MATPLSIEPELSSQEWLQKLEETVLRFVLTWNRRGSSYSLDVYTQDRTPIVTGLRVVMGTDILGGIQDDRLPPGALFAIDTETEGVPPKLGELGARVKLIYQPPT